MNTDNEYLRFLIRTDSARELENMILEGCDITSLAEHILMEDNVKLLTLLIDSGAIKLPQQCDKLSLIEKACKNSAKKCLIHIFKDVEKQDLTRHYVSCILKYCIKNEDVSMIDTLIKKTNIIIGSEILLKIKSYDFLRLMVNKTDKIPMEIIEKALNKKHFMLFKVLRDVERELSADECDIVSSLCCDI